jgi:HAD superfamily hydrolase (TIGR01509 family)
MSALKAVIFDLDGTLVDSWELHVQCVRRACASVGAPPPTAARIRATQCAAGIGGTDLATLASLAGSAMASSALAAYHDTLRARLADNRALPMPGTAVALARLARAGIATGVCTGRSRQGAAALLSSAGFQVPLLTAREDAAQPKPAPDGLRHALAQLGVAPADALYVGDAPADQQQGERARVRTLLVTRGSLLSALEGTAW